MTDEDKGIYMFVVKPYTIQNDEGKEIVIDGDIYVGMMPKDEAVTVAWLQDGECVGTVLIEPEQVATSFSRIVRIA